MASSTTAKLNENQVCKAVNALLKWKMLQSKKTHKPQNPSTISDEEEEEVAELAKDDFIYLLLILNKIPPKELTNPHKIPLPHPLQSFSNTCLIIYDNPKKSHFPKTNLSVETAQKNKPHLSKTKLGVEFVQKKIKAEGIEISKVLKISKLKAEYKSFEAKRELYNSYELFLAEKRVVNLLPGLLGKQFYKKKRKVPVPVDLKGDCNWKEEIERACSSTLLCLGSGTCSVVKIGRAGMESSEVIENVLAAVDGIVGFVPKKWGGVRAFHLKFSNSLALPVYQALIDSKKNLKKDEYGDKKKVGMSKKRSERVLAMDSDNEVEENNV